MENNIKMKIGAGILTISVIHLVVCGINLLDFLTRILLKDAVQAQVETMGLEKSVIPPIGQTVFSLALVIIIVMGIILILVKKSLGIYLYFVSTIAYIIYSVVIIGFTPIVFAELILLVLMAAFIMQKKELYGFCTKR